ncbi:unnamed protein product, partial [Ectocarpus sp. 12 AP-2014]
YTSVPWTWKTWAGQDHLPGRLACQAHQYMENRWIYYNSQGGYRLQQRMRAEGQTWEVGRLTALLRWRIVRHSAIYTPTPISHARMEPTSCRSRIYVNEACTRRRPNVTRLRCRPEVTVEGEQDRENVKHDEFGTDGKIVF